MSRIARYTKGVGFIFKGFDFFIRHPRLWLLSLIPTVINLFILAAMATIFFHYYNDIYSWFSSHLVQLKIANPDVWYLQVVNALLWVVNIIFQAFIMLLSMIILLIVSYCIGMVLAAPFNDAISERVEIMATGYEPPPFSLKKFLTDTARIVKIESLKALVLLSIPIVLFLFNFLPGVGGIIYLVTTFMFGSLSLGFSFADLPMGRKVVSLGARISFAKKHRWELMGFGVGFLVPFFSLVFSSPLVVGGTLIYVELTKNEPGRAS